MALGIAGCLLSAILAILILCAIRYSRSVQARRVRTISKIRAATVVNIDRYQCPLREVYDDAPIPDHVKVKILKQTDTHNLMHEKLCKRVKVIKKFNDTRVMKAITKMIDYIRRTMIVFMYKLQTHLKTKLYKKMEEEHNEKI